MWLLHGLGAGTLPPAPYSYTTAVAPTAIEAAGRFLNAFALRKRAIDSAMQHNTCGAEGEYQYELGDGISSPCRQNTRCISNRPSGTWEHLLHGCFDSERSKDYFVVYPGVKFFLSSRSFPRGKNITPEIVNFAGVFLIVKTAAESAEPP